MSMFSQLAAQGANSWQSISMSGGINDLENEDHSQERQVVEDATAFRQYIASYSAAALRATALSELVERSLVYKYNTLHGHSDHEEEVELGPEHESAFATLLDSMKNLSVDELVKLMIESGKGTKGPDLTQTEAEESVPAEEPLLKEVLEKIEGYVSHISFWTTNVTILTEPRVTERANAEEKAEGEDDQKKKDDVEGDEAKESQDA